MDYRRLRPDECAAAAAQHRRVGATIPGFDPERLSFGQTCAAYRDAFARGPIWGAFDGAELVGHMALETGWIEHLYVEPARQGQGIGRELVGIAQRDSDVLELWTYQANTRARGVYEAAGFLAVEFGIDPGDPGRAPNVRYRWNRPT